MLTGRVRWPGYVGVSLTYWNLGEICGAQPAEFSLWKNVVPELWVYVVGGGVPQRQIGILRAYHYPH